MMEKTVCELFAGVGGFRCGLNSIRTLEDIGRPEKWRTVWFNQWEPEDRRVQWAHSCYANHFGTLQDLGGTDTTNTDINAVDKRVIPDHNLLVGGFPCQDYSVASSLATSRGLEGRKGVLWWDIRDILEEKQPPFVLLENVDRLIKSPAKQKGRDFAIILACFRDLDYVVEWRVINAAEYGYQQRRRRVFIFAYRKTTLYASRLQRFSFLERAEKRERVSNILSQDGFFATSFPVNQIEIDRVEEVSLPAEVGAISGAFSFLFENTGIMIDGEIYTAKTLPLYNGNRRTLRDVLENGPVSEEYFIPETQLYYTNPDVTHSDETVERLPDAVHKTWQYIKGGKRLLRTAKNGHQYVFSEGPISMIDGANLPARTMLTNEGTFNRSTHIVRDIETGRIRLLTPIETERIQGFPDNWTKDCLVNGEIVEMPVKKRRFMMGNALVVNLIAQMEATLSDIVEKEE